MNFKSLFKPLLQSLLNDAMPFAKASLKAAIVGRLPKNITPEQQLVVDAAFSALDSWTVKI